MVPCYNIVGPGLPIGGAFSCRATVISGSSSSSLPTGSVTFSATSTDGGIVTLSDNSCMLQPAGTSGGESQCAVNMTATSPGTAEIELSYGGDGNYLGSSATITVPLYKQTAPAMAASCAFSHTQTGYFSGCNMDLAGIAGSRCGGVACIFVPPYPSGTVKISSSGVGFSSNSCTLSGTSGEACSFSNSTDAAQSVVVDFSYSGDSNFYGATFEAYTVTAPVGIPFYAFAPACVMGELTIGATSTCAGFLPVGELLDASVSLTQTSSAGGSIGVNSCGFNSNDGMEECSVTALSTGPLSVQASFSDSRDQTVTLYSTGTLDVLDVLPSPLEVSCSQDGLPAGTVSCGVGTGSTGTVTWSSTSPSGSFDQKTCSISSSTPCEVRYSDSSSAAAQITATFSGDHFYPASSTVEVVPSTPTTTVMGQTTSPSTTVASTANSTTNPNPIPEFPLAAVAAGTFTIGLVASYLLMRRRQPLQSKQAKA